VAKASFRDRGAVQAPALRQVLAALGRTAAARHRLLAARARNDTHVWAVKRRDRTRQLIELGGLLVKSGVVHLVDDDRAVIFGMLAEAAGKLRAEDGERLRVLWGRRGQREFSADASE
jgi:hypothetical protein